MLPRRRKWLSTLAAGIAIALLARFAWQWAALILAGSRGSGFYSLYAGLSLYSSQGGKALYDPASQRVSEAQLTLGWLQPHPFLPYAHPPFFTAAASYLALLPIGFAYVLVAILNLLLLGLAIALLARFTRLGWRLGILFGLLLVSWGPVSVALAQGQTDLLVLATLAAATLSWRTRPGLSGALVGLAMVKPHLLLLLPVFFVMRRAWSALFGFSLVAAGLVGFSLITAGIASWTGYLSLLQPWTSGQPAALLDNETVYSLRQLLELASDASRPAAIAGLVLIAGAAALALTWRPHRPELDFAVAVAVSVVLSPYQNLHDLVLLAVPLAVTIALLQSGQLRIPALGWPVLVISWGLGQLEPMIGPGGAAIGAGLLASYLVLERLLVKADPLPLPDPQWTGPARRVVVLPAYHAERTLREVVARIPMDKVDRVLLVDDASSDRTAELALELGINVIRHPRNLGYGGNQKTCYANALLMGAEVVVMLHPDGQYDPELVPALCEAVEQGRGDVVLGSRWLNLDPARAGMPWWKRLGNRALTWVENRALGLELSEYHTGYRAYSRRFLQIVPFEQNSDDFVFDTQVLVQAAAFGFRIAEIPARGRYFGDMSSIGFKTSVVYGLKTLWAVARYILSRSGLPCRWLEPHLPRQPAAISEGAAAATVS